MRHHRWASSTQLSRWVSLNMFTFLRLWRSRRHASATKAAEVINRQFAFLASLKWKISVRYESHFLVVLRQFSGFAWIFVEIIYMEMIDLLYRFCCRWIFHHIVWFWNQTESIWILFSLLWPRFCTGIVHSWPVPVIATKGWPRESAGVIRAIVHSACPWRRRQRQLHLPDRHAHLSTGQGSGRGKVSERCKKNKRLLKNLKGNRGSVYRVRAGGKTERQGQQIESKDRLVCLWAVHSRPTLSCVLLQFSDGFCGKRRLKGQLSVLWKYCRRSEVKHAALLF